MKCLRALALVSLAQSPEYIRGFGEPETTAAPRYANRFRWVRRRLVSRAREKTTKSDILTQKKHTHTHRYPHIWTVFPHLSKPTALAAVRRAIFLHVFFSFFAAPGLLFRKPGEFSACKMERSQTQLGHLNRAVCVHGCVGCSHDFACG